MINIPSYKQDPSYRYKMPKMILKVEGKGNGIKTNIVNLSLVAKALRVPVQYPLRFFGAELGTQFEYKEKQNHLSIVNGKVDYPTMLKLLDKFIDKFVLCPTCKIPEISLRVKKGLIQGKCAACGEIEKLENSHKVCNHMIKNPPKNLTEFSQKKKKDSKKKGGEDGKKKVTKKKKEILTEEDLPELSFQSEEIEQAIKRLREFKVDKDLSEISDEIKSIKIASAFKEDLKFYVCVFALFDKTIIKTYPLYAELLHKYVQKDGDLGMQYLLYSLQHFFYEEHQEIVSHIPTLLKLMYDDDVFSETFLCNWSEEALAEPESQLFNPAYDHKMKQHSKEFLTWLKEAEEESEGEENELEEEKVEIDREQEAKEELLIKQQELIQKQLEEQNKMKHVEEEEEKDVLALDSAGDDDDFDVDDI